MAGRVRQLAGGNSAVASGYIVGLPIVPDAGRQKLGRSVLRLAALLAVGVMMALVAACTKEEATQAEVQTKKGNSDDVSIDWKTITPAELDGLIVRGELDPNKLISSNSTFASPVMYATLKSDNMDLLDILVKHGADINWQESEDGFTALRVAARFGKLSMVERLLALGADIHLKDKIYEDSIILIPLLRKGITSIEKRKRITETLLAYGAQLSGGQYIRGNKISPLAAVVMNMMVVPKEEREKHEWLLPYLISLGASINESYGSNNLSAIHLSMISSDSDIVKEIVRLGGNIKLTNKYKLPPLIFFLMVGQNIQIFDMLVELGANIDYKDRNGMSVLNHALLRKKGAYDEFYAGESYIGKLPRIKKEFPTIEEWREFGDKVIARIKSLCENFKYQVCENFNGDVLKLSMISKRRISNENT